MANNIFGGSADKAQDEFKEKVDVHSKAILAVTQRQKDLESATDLLNEKIEMLDHNAISNFKKITEDIKSIRAELRELHEEIGTLKDFNSKMGKQIKLMAPRDDVAKLEKYIDLWEPMNFVTRDELEESQKKLIAGLKKVIEDFMK